MVKETSYSGNLLCFMFCIKATAHQGGNEKKWLKDIALIFEGPGLCCGNHYINKSIHLVAYNQKESWYFTSHTLLISNVLRPNPKSIDLHKNKVPLIDGKLALVSLA